MWDHAAVPLPWPLPIKGCVDSTKLSMSVQSCLQRIQFPEQGRKQNAQFPLPGNVSHLCFLCSSCVHVFSFIPFQTLPCKSPRFLLPRSSCHNRLSICRLFAWAHHTQILTRNKVGRFVLSRKHGYCPFTGILADWTQDHKVWKYHLISRTGMTWRSFNM